MYWNNRDKMYDAKMRSTVTQSLIQFREAKRIYNTEPTNIAQTLEKGIGLDHQLPPPTVSKIVERAVDAVLRRKVMVTEDMLTTVIKLIETEVQKAEMDSLSRKG